MKVICVDDSNRPKEIPEKEWIKKGKQYTVIKLVHNLKQNVKSFKLKEISISTPKYSGYAVRRFADIKLFNREPISKLVENFEKDITVEQLEFVEEEVLA